MGLCLAKSKELEIDAIDAKSANKETVRPISWTKSDIDLHTPRSSIELDRSIQATRLRISS